MTATNPRTRTLGRRSSAAALAVVLALAGCKSSSDGGGGGAAKSRDPLVYGPNRIPPQNVPLPDRGGIGAKGKADPLIGAPTGKPGDKSGVGYNDDPSRFKGPVVTGPGTAPAALAGKAKDGDELKIDDEKRVPLTPAGGVAPGAAPSLAPEPGSGVDGLFSELEKYGVKRDDRSLGREGGQYLFKASVPISGNGAKREYTGVGATATEAVKQVLDQVIADRK
jgi:hypothetical protein